MKDVIGWRTDDAVELIRNAANTQVRLDIVSAEAPMDSKPTRMVLTRAKVRLEDARQGRDDHPAGCRWQAGAPDRRDQAARLHQDFEARRSDDTYASASKDVERMLGEFRAQKMDGVVLDLRGNGGGSLSEAVELTGLFIDKGPVVQVRESGGPRQRGRGSQGRRGLGWAAAFLGQPRLRIGPRKSWPARSKDYGRGLIIGETSFGKGTVQNMVDLDHWPPAGRASARSS